MRVNKVPELLDRLHEIQGRSGALIDFIGEEAREGDSSETDNIIMRARMILGELDDVRKGLQDELDRARRAEAESSADLLSGDIISKAPASQGAVVRNAPMPDLREDICTQAIAATDMERDSIESLISKLTSLKNARESSKTAESLSMLAKLKAGIEKSMK